MLQNGWLNLNKTYIIAEIGNTHEGSLGLAKQFIKVYKPFNENRTKVRKLSSHSGRRYFATVLGNTPGITTKQLMELGGWKSPNVAMLYVESNDEHLDSLVGNAEL